MHIVRLQPIGDLDVKITLVLVIGLVIQNPGDLFVSLDGKHIVQVEHGLLPVRIFRMWASREADWLVALGELNIEPRNEGMDEVVAADFQ